MKAPKSGFLESSCQQDEVCMVQGYVRRITGCCISFCCFCRVHAQFAFFRRDKPHEPLRNHSFPFNRTTNLLALRINDARACHSCMPGSFVSLEFVAFGHCAATIMFMHIKCEPQLSATGGPRVQAGSEAPSPRSKHREEYQQQQQQGRGISNCSRCSIVKQHS